MSAKNLFRGLSFTFMFAAFSSLYLGDPAFSQTLAIAAVWAEIIAWKQ